MNILTDFDQDLSNSIKIARKALVIENKTTWERALKSFVNFDTFKESAGFQLPFLQQVFCTKNAKLLKALRDAFCDLSVKNFVLSNFCEFIRYSGRVGSIKSYFSLNKLGLQASPPNYSIGSFGEDDIIEDSSTYFSQVLENTEPTEEFWWVAPHEDISDYLDDIDKLTNALGLFCYHLRVPLRLYLVLFSPNKALCKPSYFHSRGYPGFWPSPGEWGRTVKVKTFEPGVREAIHYNKDGGGFKENIVYGYGPPERYNLDWKAYCNLQSKIISNAAEAY